MNLPSPIARCPVLSRLIPALALAAIVWCAYYPATTAGYIWDDTLHFVEDPLMDEPDGLFRIWFQPRDGHWNYWPITRSTFWIERRLWGVNASASHTINISLHLMGVLIFYFGLRRFRAPQPWFVAGLLALHPAFVESVTWVTERKNVLALVFYLLSIWSYLSFDERRQRGAYLAALGLFACALLSKSSTVMLPVILVFCRLALRRPWKRADLFLLAPFFAFSAAAASASVWFEEHVIGSSGAGFDSSWAERAAVAGRIPFFYLRILLFPWDLSFIYPRWEIDVATALAWLPAAAIVAIALALFRSWRTSPGRALALGFGAFVATLFPVLGFFDIYGMHFSFVANHWVHLPALPLLILAGASLDAAFKRFPYARPLAVGAILAACGVLTWQRNQVFDNPETLWIDTLEKNPACWVAHNNLGTILDARGERDKAVLHFAEAIRHKPDYEMAHYNLGNVALEENRLDDAIRHYSDSLRANPHFAKAHDNLGTALMRGNRMDEALHHYLEAVRIDPDFHEAFNSLGNACLQLGRLDEAIAALTESVRLAPAYEKAQYNLALAFERQGRIEDAISRYAAALQAKPDYAKAHTRLGALLLQKGDAASAISHLEEALRIDPAGTEARHLLEQARTAPPPQPR